jgi:transposase
MLRMDQVHVVRHKVLAEGRSVRQVAREMGLSRNTVRRYVSTEVVVGERKTTERPAPLREAVSARLKSLLADSPRWTGGKQRVTAMRLHQMLRDEGVQVGETIVKEIVREWRRQRQEVFVPLVYRPGDLAEVDFFEVLVDVDVEGQRRKAWMFVMRLMHSGRDFAWLYPRQDQVCFLDGHVRAFRHFGAVPQRCLYDNLRAAVARILVGSERQLATRFEAMVAHYVFEPCFARPRTGHDKGGVESRGRAIRRQHMVPIPSGERLDDVSTALLARLDAAVDDTRAAQLAGERAQMLPLPTIDFRAAAVRICVASRRSLVKVEGAVYSVPCAWAGLDVTAYVGVAEIEIAGPGGRVRHVRQPFGGRSVDYLHYLPELARKPAAVRQVAHELMPRLGSPFEETWSRLVDEQGPRDAARVFARVPRAVVDIGAAAVSERLRRAQAEGTPLSLALAPAPTPCPTLDEATLPASLQHIHVAAGRAADYDLLLGGAQ